MNFTQAERDAIAAKLRELAELFSPTGVTAQGGGNGDGPPGAS